MALKEYAYRGGTYLFEEDAVPAGAVLVEQVSASAEPAAVKTRKPQNKAVKPVNK
ncbi:hypothetical protein U6G28_02605 [Actinomycetaceae bacterium MB13-C1-2]|nr:hypothetical protein U6G28_02605 [Actinomycetaceae bacterium MB13-C1-2]